MRHGRPVARLVPVRIMPSRSVHRCECNGMQDLRAGANSMHTSVASSHHHIISLQHHIIMELRVESTTTAHHGDKKLQTTTHGEEAHGGRGEK
jgi:antitoxin (DNA-binding transcriptional repressor) of toxin-antitoxin stability system